MGRIYDKEQKKRWKNLAHRLHVLRCQIPQENRIVKAINGIGPERYRSKNCKKELGLAPTEISLEDFFAKFKEYSEINHAPASYVRYQNIIIVILESFVVLVL